MDGGVIRYSPPPCGSAIAYEVGRYSTSLRAPQYFPSPASGRRGSYQRHPQKIFMCDTPTRKGEGNGNSRSL